MKSITQLHRKAEREREEAVAWRDQGSSQGREEGSGRSLSIRISFVEKKKILSGGVRPCVIQRWVSSSIIIHHKRTDDKKLSHAANRRRCRLGDPKMTKVMQTTWLTRNVKAEYNLNHNGQSQNKKLAPAITKEKWREKRSGSFK